MNQKAPAVLIVATILVGAWGLLYGMSRLLNPEPLGPQIYSPLTAISQTPSAVAKSGLNYDQLVQQVAPPSGTTIAVHWGDMGQKLIESGAIDLAKFQAHYSGLTAEQRAALLGDNLTEITLTPENIGFWTNVWWAFGLTQKSKVLGEGPMAHNRGRTPLGNYASTGGWTLGSRPATELYNSARLIDLTSEQDALVYRVAEHVFRPCCGNSTAFPDCNHGMAVLGLLELLAAQGASEDELYRAALTFNSYAFSDTYIALAAYFAMQNIPWSGVNPRQVLGADYSAIQGAQRIAAAVGPIPGAPAQGGSCGA